MPRCGIEAVHDVGRRRGQPLAIDEAGDPDSAVGAAHRVATARPASGTAPLRTSSAIRNSPSRTPLSGATTAPVPVASSTLGDRARGASPRDRDSRRAGPAGTRFARRRSPIGASDRRSLAISVRARVRARAAASRPSVDRRQQIRGRRCRARWQEMPLRQQRAGARDVAASAAATSMRASRGCSGSRRTCSPIGVARA